MPLSSTCCQDTPTRGENIGPPRFSYMEVLKPSEQSNDETGSSFSETPPPPRGLGRARARHPRPPRLPLDRSQPSAGGSSGGTPGAERLPPGRRGGFHERSKATPSMKEKLGGVDVTESDKESTCDTGGGAGEEGSHWKAPVHRASPPLMQKAETPNSQKPEEAKQQRLERAVSELLKALHEAALSAEVLQNTPRRVASALAYFTKGYADTVKNAVGDAIYESTSHQDLVAVKDLDVSSICEHHLLPFFGKCHIVYLPGRHIVGLSKLPRIIQVFERRLQMQERLTAQVAEGLVEAIAPRGVLVMMECTHACISARGVGCRTAKTTTLAYRGVFEKDATLRSEALALIR